MWECVGKSRYFRALQALSLEGFIFSALWVCNDISRMPARFLTAVESFDFEARDGSVISSRIVSLPMPEEFSDLNFAIQTRQFRFSVIDSYREDPKVMRRLASIYREKQSMSWVLHRIERVEWKDSEPSLSNHLEEIDLVADENGLIYGSVFVELLEDTNCFMLVYKNSKGIEQRRRVIVSYNDRSD